ncbi:MAG: MBL fold metallo-hydrolase, partial [Ruminococcus sp.]
MPLQQLTPRIYQLPFSEAEDRPCLGYIRGERFSLMVDAGNSPEHVRDYQQALREAGFPLPQFTVLTHSHWDHCFGLHALQIPAIA